MKHWTRILCKESEFKPQQSSAESHDCTDFRLFSTHSQLLFVQSWTFQFPHFSHLRIQFSILWTVKRIARFPITLCLRISISLNYFFLGNFSLRTFDLWTFVVDIFSLISHHSSNFLMLRWNSQLTNSRKGIFQFFNFTLICLRAKISKYRRSERKFPHKNFSFPFFLWFRFSFTSLLPSTNKSFGLQRRVWQAQKYQTRANLNALRSLLTLSTVSLLLPRWKKNFPVHVEKKKKWKSFHHTRENWKENVFQFSQEMFRYRWKVNRAEAMLR